MSDLETGFSVEQGGYNARTGFRYQDYVATWWLIQMLEDASLVRIGCEIGDDILAIRTTPDGELHLYVQVKFRDSPKPWTLSDITSPESASGRSLIQKGIARAAASTARQYRVVSNHPPAPELEVLLQEVGERNPEALLDLGQRLEAKFGDLSADVHSDTPLDWLRKTKWLPLGGFEAVRDYSLWRMYTWFASRRLFLGPGAVEDIHSRLLKVAQDLATGSWAAARGEHTICRDALVEICLQFGRACAQPMSPDAERELRAQLEDSFQRCRDRWIAVGVSTEDAAALAEAADVGENLIGAFQLGNVAWVQGEFGLGKSLAADRTFQAVLKAYLDGIPGPIPVFIEARGLSTDLRKSIETAVARIGHDPHRHGVFIILDGLDESGRLTAVKLLQEALRLSRVWRGSKVLLTSTALDYEDTSLPRVQLRGLDTFQAYDIINFISKREFIPPMAAEMKWHPDLFKPLIAVLIGVAYSRGTAPISIAEAIRFVVERALTGAFNHTHFLEVKDALMVLASRLVDSDGEAVPSIEIARPEIIERMMSLRFVVRTAGRISFAVSLFADWFAAESLRRDLSKLTELRNEPVRLWLWRNAVAAWISEQPFASAAEFLEPLVRKEPALACEIMKLSSRQRPSHDSIEQADWATRWLGAVRAWGEGLGKLAVFLPGTDSATSVSAEMCENMLLITVGSDVGLTQYAFARDDSPVWLWEAARSTVSTLVEQLIGERVLLDPAGRIAKEKVWSWACRLIGANARRARSVNVLALEDRLSNMRLSGGGDLLVRSAIMAAKAKGLTELPAPHPQEDLEGPANQWVDDLWTPEQRAKRAMSIYTDALQAYASLVETYFPCFRRYLSLYALMPCLMEGTLEPNQGDFTSAIFRFTPLPTGEQSSVSFRIGSSRFEDSTEEDWKTRQEILKRLRPDSWPWTSISLHSGHLETFNEDSVARVAYDWLQRDLRRVGFLR